jgi:hypothetical protein
MINFTFAEMSGELKAMKRMASGLLEVLHPLDRAVSTLESIKSSQKPSRWEIPQNDPIRTIPSKSYVSSGDGRHHVVAEISFVWDISPIAARRSADEFVLTGIASTRVTIRLDDADGPVLAMFRMEVGDSESPGSHFHSQILGQDGWAGEDRAEMDEVFPEWLKVPRLPFPVATPAFALEFSLSELFQDDYLRSITHRQGDVQIWQSIQRRRFERLLGWQLRTVKDTAGSPWLALKKAKPIQELFTAKD